MIAEFQNRLQTEFPDKKVSVKLEASSDYKPRACISVDGKEVRAQWDLELAQDLKALHGIEVEMEVFGALVEQIKHELGVGGSDHGSAKEVKAETKSAGFNEL